MKRLFLACAGVVVFFSLLLHFTYNYSWTVVMYHFVIMGLTLSIAGAFLCLLSIAVPNRLRSAAVLIAGGLAFFGLSIFYTLTLVSNHFWHKTITLSILKNYTQSIDELVAIIPLQQGVIVAILVAYLGTLVALYVSVRPKAEHVAHWTKNVLRTHRGKLIAFSLFFVALGIAFYRPLLNAKRVMHMAEEPLLQFVFGAMWGNNNDIAFDRVRFENGLKDKSCADSVKAITGDRTIVIVLVDGLRADHLTMYGYGRNTTPFLDSLYRSGRLLAVKNAFSTSTNTIGGLAGLFFSKDWLEFGFNGLSLMKFFKLGGYKTHAFLTGFHRDWYGLSALYRESADVYYESSDNPEVKNDDDLVTLQRFSSTAIPKRSFVFIHLLSVHMVGKKNREFRRFLPDKIGFDADKKTALSNNYDNGILQSDFVIRRVFDKLATDRLLNQSTVFILSDHGELFGEQGGWGHGDNIHEKLLEVPLLVFDNDLGWYQNNETATLKDVAPTVVERLGSTVPSCWEGVSLKHRVGDFVVEVNSAEECTRPHGVLTRKGNGILLSIMDRNGNTVRTVNKTNGSWNAPASTE